MSTAATGRPRMPRRRLGLGFLGGRTVTALWIQTDEPSVHGQAEPERGRRGICSRLASNLTLHGQAAATETRGMRPGPPANRLACALGAAASEPRAALGVRRGRPDSGRTDGSSHDAGATTSEAPATGNRQSGREWAVEPRGRRGGPAVMRRDARERGDAVAEVRARRSGLRGDPRRAARATVARRGPAPVGASGRDATADSADREDTTHVS